MNKLLSLRTSHMRSDRRSVLRGVGAAIAAPFVLRSVSARAEGQIVFATFGGTVTEAIDDIFLKPFSKQSGIKVVTTGAVELAKMKAQVLTGRPSEWDLVSLQPAEVLTAMQDGLVEPIDYSIVKVTEADFVYPEAKRTHWVSTQNYTGGIAFNSTKFAGQKAPANWKDFWNVEKFPGRRGLRSRPQDTLEIGLLAAGATSADIYPIDVKRSLASLDKIKPHVVKWIDTAPQSIQLVQTEEVDFSYTFHNRVAAAQTSGLPLAYSKEQLLIFFNAYAVPKGARNAKGAMELLNFMMRPELQAELWNRVKLIPLAMGASTHISAEDRAKWIPNPSDGHVPINAEWWGAPGRLAEVTTQFRNWLLT